LAADEDGIFHAAAAAAAASSGSAAAPGPLPEMADDSIFVCTKQHKAPDI
jgi:hypothetical protein